MDWTCRDTETPRALITLGRKASGSICVAFFSSDSTPKSLQHSVIWPAEHVFIKQKMQFCPSVLADVKTTTWWRSAFCFLLFFLNAVFYILALRRRYKTTRLVSLICGYHRFNQSVCYICLNHDLAAWMHWSLVLIWAIQVPVQLLQLDW